MVWCIGTSKKLKFWHAMSKLKFPPILNFKFSWPCLYHCVFDISRKTKIEDNEFYLFDLNIFEYFLLNKCKGFCAWIFLTFHFLNTKWKSLQFNFIYGYNFTNVGKYTGF